MKLKRIQKLFVIVLCLLGSTRVHSQYILNGSAQQVSCNCYTLTPAQNTKSGSVWNSNKINLQNPFDFWFKVFLGCNDDTGADGIVFILQSISTSVGTTGEGMGFQGVSPSIGIALDTYQNLNQNDPSYDHISIQKNGLVNHTTDLAGPVPASATSNNIEDCQWHKLRISWDPATHWLRAYFDGVLRVETQVDLVTDIFNNDPNVYWGFTGATGGSVNLQQFCTALDPDFSTNITANNGCVNQPIVMANQSESFAPIASYNWDFGDGNTSTDPTPPPHTYTTPGTYTVRLQATGLDGCAHDTTKTIRIGALPSASLHVNDTCFLNLPRVSFPPPGFGINYSWSLDGGPSTTLQPAFNTLTSGAHSLSLTATSIYDCGAPVTATSNFLLKPIPLVGITYGRVCLNFMFPAQQSNPNEVQVATWNWDFGDGTTSTTPWTVNHTFPAYGDYTVKLMTTAVNGCTYTSVFDATISPPYVFAGNDTTVISGVPAQLHATGNGDFWWTPTDAFTQPNVADPVITTDQDREYTVRVTTQQGCMATDVVKVKVMKGPAIYVPSAFTPNGDGKNDRFQPTYVGMKKLVRFVVFNRWGQQVFATTDMSAGWDGSTAQQMPASSTYVWMIQAVNYLDQPVMLKGTVILIR